MELNTLSLPQFTRLANVIFDKMKMAVEASARSSGIWRVESIPANSGDVRDYQEIDRDLYARRKNESDQAARAKVVTGYNKNVRLARFAKDVGISYEMRRFNKYPEVVSALTALAQDGTNRLELDLSHRLSFGTSTSYTDMDGSVVDISVGNGLSLFNTAHTLTGSAATYRNRLAGNPIVSKGALEGIERLAVEEQLNNFGEKIVQRFDILWTTEDPSSVNTVLEYLKSVASPDFANSGVTNVYQAKYRHVKLPLIATTAAGAVDSSKRKYWGLASSISSDMHLAVWDEPYLKNPSNLNAGEEFSTDDWSFGVRAGWGICAVTGRGILFSSGDNAA